MRVGFDILMNYIDLYDLFMFIHLNPVVLICNSFIIDIIDYFMGN